MRLDEIRDAGLCDAADIHPFDTAFLSRVATRIVNEVKSIDRVVYEPMPKPPGTIEWERSLPASGPLSRRGAAATSNGFAEEADPGDAGSR